MQKENAESVWFMRVAFVLMVVMISVGVVPIAKNMMFPPEKSSR